MPDKDFLVPTIAQDSESGQVLMLAYSNRESLHKTFKTGEAHYWSRSRNSLWKKGETSGNTQQLITVALDCDADALLFRVKPSGPACHTGAVSCFFTRVEDAQITIESRQWYDDFFSQLFELIERRKIEKPENSYTRRLLSEGVDRIARKIAEESGEVIIAAKNGAKAELLWESADLIYHLMVLLASQNLTWNQVSEELQKRSEK
ncbi:MAG TPA: bifunctional phosphoribosyl-AMP cyclohydrolase/phosphoribosyl-ATP diphosphatase HisIE [Acidobacteriota bacterium]|jgi:phosphoribosyl-ATP pyrophosphohydrolase/phosphoribosyl-AMP cyclohydrolase